MHFVAQSSELPQHFSCIKMHAQLGDRWVVQVAGSSALCRLWSQHLFRVFTLELMTLLQVGNSLVWPDHRWGKSSTFWASHGPHFELDTSSIANFTALNWAPGACGSLWDPHLERLDLNLQVFPGTQTFFSSRQGKVPAWFFPARCPQRLSIVTCDSSWMLDSSIVIFIYRVKSGDSQYGTCFNN